MHVVAIYNNKGGVGKSTITVGIAEFLASNRKKKVLVIDLDAQASSAQSILGPRSVLHAIQSGHTFPALVQDAYYAPRSLNGKSVENYARVRRASDSRGTALEQIDVLPPSKTDLFELEEEISSVKKAKDLMAKGIRPLLKEYDFVLVDCPGNLDRRSILSVATLCMSDFVLIPVEPSEISLEALPHSFEFIQYVQQLNGNARPAVIGMLLNKTDKRSQQYRAKFPSILETSELGQLPPVFDNFLPDTPKLATATDGTIDFHTLKSRFSTYYDNVRKVARELEQRCEKFEFPKKPKRNRFQKVIEGLLGGWAGSRA